MDPLTSQRIDAKVLELTEQFNRYVFDHPDILEQLPNHALLVFLDPEDAEFNRVNLERAQATHHPEAGTPVYIEMRHHIRVIQQVEWQPQIVAPPLAV